MRLSVPSPAAAPVFWGVLNLMRALDDKKLGGWSSVARQLDGPYKADVTVSLPNTEQIKLFHSFSCLLSYRGLHPQVGTYVACAALGHRGLVESRTSTSNRNGILHRAHCTQVKHFRVVWHCKQSKDRLVATGPGDYSFTIKPRRRCSLSHMRFQQMQSTIAELFYLLQL